MTPGFTEDWFCEASCEVLAGLVRSVAEVDGLIVEIGSWEGRSTVAMAAAAHPRIVHAVDTWRGSPGEISEVLAGQRDVYAQFCANVAAFSAGNVEAHRAGWRDYLPTITRPVALAFVDAEHTYAEVHDNIAALMPLMASGGVICGDDVNCLPVRRAVADLLNPHRVDVKATVWSWRAP